MGASVSCLDEATQHRRFTRIRCRKRGFRIKRRVQALWKFVRKFRLGNGLQMIWLQRPGSYFAAATRRKHLKRRHQRLVNAQNWDFSEGVSSISEMLQQDDWSLMPGLPPELAMRCLAMVPRVHHCQMRSVCKLWRHTVESLEFLELRKQMGLTEDWLYLHVGSSPHLDETQGGYRSGRWQLVGGFSLWHALDPFRYRWHALPPIPYDRSVTGGHVVLGAASVVLNGDLYVLGGAPFGMPALRDIWIYVPRQNKWRRGKPMLMPRFGCLVGVIENKLYVVGGSGICHLTGYSFPCLEVYDPITDSWQYAASARGRITAHPCSPLKHIAVLENRLCVTGPQTLTRRANSGMYDPELDSWMEIKPGLQSGWGRPSAMLDGKLYTVGFGCYQQYWPEKDMWQPVSQSATPLEWDTRIVSAMTASNGKIYMVGTMGPALIVIIAPVEDGHVSQSVWWHTMKLPNGIDFLGDLNCCSCQIISI